MKKIALAAALLAVPFVAQAETVVKGQNPYVECGIGAAIFPNVYWAAAISNAIWDLGTTAITSHMSSPETCNGRTVKTATLIMETLDAMERDVANGGGSSTVALADTMGCAAGNREAMVTSMRDSYSVNVASTGYAAQSREARALGMYTSAKAAAASTCAVAL